MEQEKRKRRPVHSSTYDFSENDVDACQSLDKLREWYEKAEMDVNIMQDKINNPENQSNKSESWMRKIQSALRAQLFLKRLVLNKIIQLKNKPPQYCFLEMKIAEEAENILDSETFNEIRKSAEKKIVND